MRPDQEMIMLRSAVLCMCFATVVGCQSEADVEAWEALNSGVSYDRASSMGGDADATDASLVLSDYECTYKCTGSNRVETAIVHTSSTAAAEQTIINNNDDDGDGLDDYCPNGDVKERSVDCESAG